MTKDENLNQMQQIADEFNQHILPVAMRLHNAWSYSPNKNTDEDLHHVDLVIDPQSGRFVKISIETVKSPNSDGDKNEI